MTTLQELREELSNTDGAILKLRDKAQSRKDNTDHQGDLLSPEERSSFTKMKSRRAELRKQIDEEEKASDVRELLEFEQEAEERSRRGSGGSLDPNPTDRIPGEDRSYGDRFGKNRDAMRNHAETEERRKLALAAWGKSRADIPLSEEERSACQELSFDPGRSKILIPNWSATDVRSLRRAAGNFNGEERSMRMERSADKIEERAIAGTANKATVVPQVTARAFEVAMATYGGLINSADIMVSDNGGKEAFPSADDRTNEGHQIDEVAAESTDSTDPDLDLILLGLYEFSSKFVRVANSMLRDGPSEFATMIGTMVALRIAKAVERKATLADGNGTLRGLLTDVTDGIQMADAAVISWAETKRLKYSVDSMYRNGGTFMLNDDTLAEFMLLVDGNGRPLLTEANGDDPQRLLGSQFVINNFFPTVDTLVAGQGLVTFGNHRAYKMKMSANTRIEQARERFIEFNQTAFIGFRGADGALQTAGEQVKSLHAA